MRPRRRWTAVQLARPTMGATGLLKCLALGLSVLSGCGGEDPPTGPTVGSIRVTVVTTGADAPSDYTVLLDGGSDLSVEANGSVTFASVSAGTHAVALMGVPAHCSVADANPVMVAVSAGSVASVDLSVQCTAQAGAIEVTVATVGDDIPVGYALTLDGGAPRSVSANGSLSLTGLAPGGHSVELTEIPRNCSVTGDNPVTSVVEAGSSVEVSIAVECTVVPTAARLLFAEQPEDVGAGRVLPSITVEILTESWEPAVFFAEPVTIEAPGAELQGTTTVVPVDGVALFTDLAILTEGEYRLRVTAPSLPAAVSDAFHVRFPWSSVVAGNISSCGIGEDGGLYCWGGDDYEALGNGTGGPSEAPVRIGDGYEEVSVGYLGGCAIRTGGGSDCWGNNEFGQVGIGSSGGTVDSPVPVSGGADHRHISVAYDFTCAIADSGSASCWGENLFGQLGNGTRTNSTTPVAVDIAVALDQITTGNGFACGLTSDGRVYCWGFANYGALGPGPLDTCEYNGFQYACALRPIVLETGLRFAEIQASGGYVCGLTAAGAIHCWGAGGPLSTLDLMETCGPEGRPPDPCSTVPLLVNDEPAFSSISSHGYICGLTAGHDLFCWIGSGAGLGIGPWPLPQDSPAPVIDGSGFETVSVFEHTCGVKQTGVGYCWGGNKKRQLGVGSTEDFVWSPEPIVSPVSGS